MRVPVILAAALLAFCASGAQRSDGATPATAPLLLLERSDAGTRAEGLVARRMAIYADGEVLSTGTLPDFARGRIAPGQVAELADLVAKARLAELPAIVESRAAWFDLSDAATTLRWSGEGAAVVRIAGDLRPDAADRALAPHGLVRVIEFVESIPIVAERGSTAGDVTVEFTLEPWTARDTSPFGAVVELEPRPWPVGSAAPVAGSARVGGSAARELAQCAREGRPVTWAGKTWRVRGQPLLPSEHAPRSASALGAPQHG